MKKALVTGGAGFIGSHLVDALLGAGTQVMVLDNLCTGRRENLSEAQSKWGDRLVMHEVNIADPDAAQALLAFKPEAVFHLAAQMNVRRSVEAPVFDTRENVVGTVNMLEAAHQAGTPCFLFSSTGGAIYGEQDYFPADEKHPLRPKCPYGVSKRAAELYLEYYAREYAMRCIALRFANVYGPRQNPFGEAGVVAIFAGRAYAGKPLCVNGDGEQTRDFVFVQDVVDACLRAAEKGRGAELQVYNVGTSLECSVNDVVAAMQSVWPEIAGTRYPALKIEHGPALAGEQKRSVIDAAKLTKELGWHVRTELAPGLRSTILSFQPQ